MAEQMMRDPSLGELWRQLSTDTSALVRDEIKLAKAELADKGREIGFGAGLLGAGLVTLLAALGAFTAFAVLIVATVLPAYAAALIVFGAFLLVTAVLLLAGKGRLQRGTPPVPERTIDSVKEDVAWLKSGLSRSGRT